MNEQKTSPMPNFYAPPLQTPLPWHNEQSGTLRKALMAYHEHMLNKQKPFQGTQFALVRDYLRYYINAPCWQQGDEGQIDALRESVTKIKTPEEMADWIMDCLNVGIDPL